MSFEFRVDSQLFRCEVDDDGNFEVSTERSARRLRGRVMRNANGRWFVASRDLQISAPMVFRIERYLNEPHADS